MPYQMPTNILNMTGMLSWSMEVTHNMFGGLLLMAIFVVIFIAFKNYTTDRAFGVAAYTVFVLGWLFRWLELISDLMLFSTILLGATGLVWTYLAKQREG